MARAVKAAVGRPAPGVVPLTKLTPPRVSPGATRRDRLLHALSAAVENPLTLVVAPAGYGKTVLVSTWVEHRTAPGFVAWLTIDDRDDDPRRFWTAVLAALDRSGALNETDGLAALGPPRRGSQDEFLALLMNGLCALRDPLVLVIDDFQELSDRRALAGVEYLLRHSPPMLRVVLMTRRDPALSVTRLELRREATVLRAAALAFTEDEAGDLLAGAGIDLAHADLAVLVERTEGWAAGLALATMSLEGADDPGARLAEFAGDDRAVADYLASEVLAQLRPDLRDFMVRASAVDEVSAELAEELTGRKDARRLLDELAETNSFVVAVGGRSRWYRFHTLFLELLRSRLAQFSAGVAADVHRRAAHWYAAHDLPFEAIRHAVNAEDWPFAAALIRQHWLDAYLSGHAVTMRHLLARLPSELAERDPRLALAFAGNRLELGEVSEADRNLRRAVEGMDGQDHDDAFDETLAFVTLHRARLRGDLDEAVASAQRLLGAEPRRIADGATARQLRRRAYALLLLGSAELWTDRLGEARRHLRGALALARENGEDYVLVGSLSHLALVDVLNGRLRSAAELSREAIELARRRGWSGAPAAAPAYLAQAVAQLHWNDAHAIRTIKQAASAVESGNHPLRVAVALAQARIRMRDGGPAGARRGLEELEFALDRASGTRLPSPLQAFTRGSLPRLLIAVGQPDDAAALLKRAEPCAEVAVVEARFALANGDPALALEALAPYLRHDAKAYLATRIEAFALAALAHQARLDRALAVESLEVALALAEPDGFRWPLLQTGPPLRELLTRQIRSGTAHRALVGELLTDLRDGADGHAGERQLLHPLTEREQAVLRYLPTLLSNAEIAAELYVSINTVKAHVKSIYRKLGTTRRKDAVRRGRALRLL
jgi:LuxR family transcriptional regulator, maltose regulon positive regulatory protein